MEKYLKTPLYHGTDDFIVYMSKEEREDMKKKCFLSSRLKNLKKQRLHLEKDKNHNMLFSTMT